jgi:Zn-dependent peptidase ImmA (M78 family)
VPKVRPPSERAVAVARHVLAEAKVRHPEDIHMEKLAARHGAMVLYVPMSTARGAIVRAGQSAIIHVSESARGTPAADFTVAHEFSHHLLHTLVDHYAQCTTDAAERTDVEWGIEREANECAAELRVPEAMAAPLCAAPRATVESIDRLARTFRTSFEMSAIRMVELTMAPCAVVMSEGTRVRWAIESLTFPGAIARWSALHPESLAARLPRRPFADREREVPGAAWKGRGPFVERAWAVGPGRVLSWIVPAE